MTGQAACEILTVSWEVLYGQWHGQWHGSQFPVIGSMTGWFYRLNQLHILFWQKVLWNLFSEGFSGKIFQYPTIGVCSVFVSAVLYLMLAKLKFFDNTKSCGQRL